LTDHRSIPKGELEESEHRAGPGAQIYWLNWYGLFLWVDRKLSDGSSRPYSEQRILLTLKSYLSAKGYETFLTWRPSARLVRGPYCRKYTLTFRQPRRVQEAFMHTYFDRRIGKMSPLLYVSRYPDSLS
jgi:hypothetical protein